MDEIKLQTCSEIYCLLKYFPKVYINKLPPKLFDLIKLNSNSKYFIEVDITKSLDAQNISKETKNFLVVLKYNYWSDESEKINIITRLNKNERKYQEELREKYNPDKLFENSLKKIETASNSVALVKYKESFFTKIKKWIKRNIK